MKYAITGAAGNISKPLVLELLKQGHSVRAIGRSEQHLKPLFDAGAEMAIGSLEDVAFLKKSFAGVDAVYTMFPSEIISTSYKNYYELLGKNYAEAIKSCGLKYVVNLSSIGAHLSKGAGPVSGLHVAERILDDLGINLKHLRPGFFYRNLFNFIGMIKAMDLMGSNYSIPSKEFPVADSHDVAAVAAEELTALNFSGSSVRYIASDETGTDEIASTLGNAIGKPGLKWIQFTDEQALQGLAQAGFPAHLASELIELWAAFNSKEFFEDYWKHRPQLGNVKLEDFTQNFAAAYPSQQNVLQS